MFAKIYDFELTDANLVYFKNITHHIPLFTNDTFTDSLKIRSEQIFGKSVLQTDEIQIQKDIFTQKFYKDYFTKYVTRTSKQSLLWAKGTNFNSISVTLDSDNGTMFTEIGYYSIREPRLLGISDYKPAQDWRFCFHHRFRGKAEAQGINKYKNQMALALRNNNTQERTIRFYDSLDCDYSEARATDYFLLDYCDQSSKERTEDLLCQNLSIIFKDEGVEERLTSSTYSDISLGNSTRVLHLAVSDRLVAYTLLDDPGRIHIVYKDMSGDWIHKQSRQMAKLRECTILHAVGLQFISSTSMNEKQLFYVLIYGDSKVLYTHFFIYKVIHGSKLINNTALYDDYNIENDTIIDVNEYYISSAFSLGDEEQDITVELNGYDWQNPHPYPDAEIDYDHKRNLMVVTTLQKYVYLFQFGGDITFKLHPVTSFVGQNFKIKKACIGGNGEYLGFLTYNQERQRVYLMNVEDVIYYYDPELFLVNFD